MIVSRLATARLRVIVGLAATAALLFAFGLLASGPARAGVVTFGSTLNTVPTLDTANGAYANNGDATGTENAVTPNPHYAEDTSVWNTGQSSGSPVATAGGQVLQVKVEGCAIEDNSAPTQLSENVPVNLVVFQSLEPDAAGGYTATSTYGLDPTGNSFEIPFCSNSAKPSTGAVNTSTITTYTPFRACISAGEVGDVHDIGGFVPAVGGNGPWYPQGIPLDIIAAVKGSSMESFVGSSGLMDPGVDASDLSGWAKEANQEVEVQIVEGTGNDAWSSCPGGEGSEPNQSNQIVCDFGSSPVGYPPCNAQGQPAAPATGTGSKPGGKPASRANVHLTDLGFSSAIVKAKAGLTVDYNDAATGATTLKIFEEVFGRRHGGKCDPTPTGAEHSDPICRFFKQVGVYHHLDSAGRNSVHIDTSTFDAGTYQIKLSAKGNGKLARLLVKTFKVTGAKTPVRAAPKPAHLSQLGFSSSTIAPATGLTVHYLDAAAGTTTIKIFQERFGRKAGGRCDTTPSRAEHSDPVCRFFKQVGEDHHKDVAGPNAVHLDTAGYRAGTYQVKLSAKGGGKIARLLVKTFDVTGSPHLAKVTPALATAR